MDKKITLDEWLEIATEVLTTFSECYSDDGKISVKDGINIILCLLKAVVKAYKTE